MKVLKFGGSSVGSAQQITILKGLVEKQDESCVIVVSAMNDITDKLIRLSKMAASHNEAYLTELSELAVRHTSVLTALFESTKLDEIKLQVNKLLTELSEVLKGVYLINDLTTKTLDYILSFGERISSYIVSKVLKDSIYIDSREIIKTNSDFGNAQVNFELTQKLIIEKIGNKKSKYFVLPGFIASNDNGDTTTIGRGGSDYTSAIVASALDAESIEIWVDVDGFMSADPKMVEKAHTIEQMTYSEAIELSHFGAKIISSPTIHKAYRKNIPIFIRNSFNLDSKGTHICKQPKVDGLIKGISSISDINLITIQGTGMVGVPGTSKRLFGSLAGANVNVILITQASSEYTITFAIKPDDSAKALKAIEEEFNSEINISKELLIQLQTDLSIVAIVGESMKNLPGISATLFKSLYHNGVNVIATAQGSSELNISIAIKKDSLKKALNALHEGFFLSGYKELNVFLVGTGVVGGAFLNQIAQQQKILLHTRQLKVNVMGIANVDKMLFRTEGILLDDWTNVVNNEGENIDLSAFVARIKELNLPNSVFVDCTAHPAPASNYFELLNNYVSVVTPNKIACSSEYKHYTLLKDTARARGVKFLYETNVGAGLPVINTLNDLVMSGDKVVKIEAVLSGTLNFIFNVISADVPLSKTIRMAKEKGYSEPDPRIDLSGKDVVRKILILARESGYQLEMDDIQVNTFLPPDCFEGSVDDFWGKVERHDTEFETRRQELEKLGKRWRFVAKFENSIASVQLMELDREHPAYQLEGSNNIIILTTERYKELPMVIKGYGAGAEVTAAGVFADVIRIANVF